MARLICLPNFIAPSSLYPYYGRQMMGASIRQIWFSSLALVFLGAGCGSSKTADQISGFADKVCACPDAACATAVQTEYLQWWEQNQRARGSEGDRKDVEQAMERYAQCHLKLVGPEPASTPVTVPKVDLEPATAPPMAPRVPPANEITPPTEEAGSETGKGKTTAPEGAGEAAKTAPKATKDDPATP
jgi:hypothetical protein